MKQLILSILITLFFSPPLLAKKHIIKIGESLLLPINSKHKVSISGSKYIKWSDLGSKIKIQGQSEGLSEIKTLNKNYKIQIINKKKHKIYLMYKKLLKSLKGLDIDFVENTPAINGNLYRFKDWEKIYQVAQKYQVYFLMNAKIDKDVQELALKKLNPLLFTYSQFMPQLKLIPHPTIYRLKNSSTEDFDHIFKLMGFRIKEHNLEHLSKQIRLNLNFIELSKSNSTNFGLSWSGAFQAKVLKSFADNSSFDALLNQSSDNGHVNIVYQTQLICEINRECQFSEGGQFPVRTSGYINSSVVWKDYGLTFKFTPNLLSDEKVKLKLQYDISHLDSSGDGQLPAIKSKTLLTYVNTKNKTPIIVSGLESSVSRNGNKGPMPFSHIPLLNKILTSNSNNKLHTKMALIVTPTLLSGDE